MQGKGFLCALLLLPRHRLLGATRSLLHRNAHKLPPYYFCWYTDYLVDTLEQLVSTSFAPAGTCGFWGLWLLGPRVLLCRRPRFFGFGAPPAPHSMADSMGSLVNHPHRSGEVRAPAASEPTESSPRAPLNLGGKLGKLARGDCCIFMFGWRRGGATVASFMPSAALNEARL